MSTPFSFTPTLVNPFNTTVRWESIGAALPGWLTLNTETGELSGDNPGLAVTGLQLRCTDGQRQVLTPVFDIAARILGSPLVWLDGDNVDGANDAGRSVGDPVASWSNALGSLGGTFAQATSSAQPTYFNDGNGFKGADFTGVVGADVNNDFLDLVLASPIAQPYVAVGVVKLDNASSQSLLQTKTPAGTTAGRSVFGHGGSGVSSNAGDTTLNDSGAALSTSQWHIIIVDVNGASSSIYVDGTTTTGDVGTASAEQRLRLGADIRSDLSGRAAQDGKTAFAGLWQGAGRPSISAIASFLASKYGVAFPFTP